MAEFYYKNRDYKTPNAVCSPLSVNSLCVLFEEFANDFSLTNQELDHVCLTTCYHKQGKWYRSKPAPRLSYEKNFPVLKNPEHFYRVVQTEEEIPHPA